MIAKTQLLIVLGRKMQSKPSELSGTPCSAVAGVWKRVVVWEREQKPSGVPYTAQKPPTGSKAPLSVWILKMLQTLSPFSSVPSRKETDAFISDQRRWKTMPHGAKQSR